MDNSNISNAVRFSPKSLLRRRRFAHAGNSADQHMKCKCLIKKEYPGWMGEVHGIFQILYSEKREHQIFWLIFVSLCFVCCFISSSHVVYDYLQGKTATSNTIRSVRSLGFPAITVCPKVPDAFNFTKMFADLNVMFPNLTESMAEDLIKFWIGGSGLENMSDLFNFNASHLATLDDLYKKWAQGKDVKTFFYEIQVKKDKYGYKCKRFFKKCRLGGHDKDCCTEIFKQKPVLRRGLCYQTLEQLNQTCADDVGRLVLQIRNITSITSPQYDYRQQQIVIYVNDNFAEVLDYPRFYLYPNEWNRMRITARHIELLEYNNDCTNKFTTKDTNCILFKWLYSAVIEPHNCTFPYMDTLKGMPYNLPICEPITVAKEYSRIIERVHTSVQNCIPGCDRWEYSVNLQQYPAVELFDINDFTFNLEVSFNDLQYEHVKEVDTMTIPGLLSQIGGQFGFFLGLSSLTIIQFIAWAPSFTLRFIRSFRKLEVESNVQEFESTNC